MPDGSAHPDVPRLRTVEEIAAWYQADAVEKRGILAQLAERRAALAEEGKQ